MTGTQALIDLQWTQLTHDERYHKDIVILPVAQRVKHMALHMAKYAGYLAEIDGDDPERIARILTDAFVIALATANALNQDLSGDLGEVAEGGPSLNAIGNALKSDVDTSNDVTGLLRRFTRHVGALAKACESIDHLERFDFRDTMRKSNLALFEIVVAAAASRGIDLATLYHARLRGVEERSIFDRHIQYEAAVR